MTKRSDSNDTFKRRQVLEKLFQSPDGLTRNEFQENPDIYDGTISDRTFYNTIVQFEKLGAVFTKIKKGREMAYRYEDPNFTIFKDLNKSLDILNDTLKKLENMQDPQLVMLRIALQQFKQGIDVEGNTVMSFDDNSKLMGLDLVSPLADAILNKQPLIIYYREFNDHEKEYKIHPYHLRQYNKRWVLFGLNVEKNEIYNLPVDRIEDYKELDEDFIPTKINFSTYFKDIIGYTNYADREVEKVKIRILHKDNTNKYIETKPFHPSQRTLDVTDEYTDIQLTVKQNKELESQLLSYGDHIEVLEPQSLRERLKGRAEALAKLYNQ